MALSSPLLLDKSYKRGVFIFESHTFKSVKVYSFLFSLPLKITYTPYIISSSKLEVKYMHFVEIEFDKVAQIQEIFGVQDELIKIIERKLCVAVEPRDTGLTIQSSNPNQIKAAHRLITSMKNLLDKGEVVNAEVVNQLLEADSDNILEETCRVMGDSITMNYQGSHIRPKTVGQNNYVKAMKDNLVVTCIGPAGTGKTYLAVAYAAEELKNNRIQKIILSRPAIEAGERLGFLPGDLEQKVDPYLRPLYDALNDIFGVEGAAKRREKGEIEIAPLAYMRGRTLSNSIVIIDESQNATLPILKMALTRIGQGSKMILTGDVTQIDLSKTDGKESGLQKCANIISGIDNVANITLNNRDVVRCKIVRDIVKAFEKEEQKNTVKTSRGRNKK